MAFVLERIAFIRQGLESTWRTKGRSWLLILMPRMGLMLETVREGSPWALLASFHESIVDEDGIESTA